MSKGGAQSSKECGSLQQGVYEQYALTKGNLPVWAVEILKNKRDLEADHSAKNNTGSKVLLNA
jgi:hypothetical protein